LDIREVFLKKVALWIQRFSKILGKALELCWC